jgi:hypothetical protein
LPIVTRPSKRCGCWDKRVEMPPVDMVKVNQAHVKWIKRSRKGISPLMEGKLALLCRLTCSPMKPVDEGGNEVESVRCNDVILDWGHAVVYEPEMGMNDRCIRYDIESKMVRSRV